MPMDYDFCGWATKNDLQCADNRIIRKDAFKGNDGNIVPLVWNHDHNDPGNVLGHALLENRDEGVYFYGSFNNTDAGKNAKEFVKHGDVTSVSIYANKLKQNGNDVIHGIIREVSLVLAGANPGAKIEYVLEHGGYDDEEAVIISCYEELEHTATNAEEPPKKPTPAKGKKEKKEVAEEMDNKLEHTEDMDDELEHAEGKTVKEVWNSLNDKQKKVAQFIIGTMVQEKNGGKVEQSAFDDDYLAHEDEETVKDVWDTFTPEQKKCVEILADAAMDENIDEGEEDMGHNVFENDMDENVLSHSEMVAICNEARSNNASSLRDVFLAHGIEDIEYLFPDAKNLNTPPEFIKRPDSWVSTVMNGVHHTPFSRIKSMFADITEADARAKGYIKGRRKTEEVFGLLKRITTPTTVYKKQKLDRDDVLDITDFDVIAWLKTEMRGMLDEEIARAILIGDGRNAISEDKINEQCIRPIWTDDDLFTIKKAVAVDAAATDDQKAKAFIRNAVKARVDYRGTGRPTLFTTEEFLTDCLLLEDTIGYRLYKSEQELATALRVNAIVTVPVMEGVYREVNGKTYYLGGLIVNLADYNVGADKGGAVNMFDDFDIDYNQMKYLIETRCSGALTKPYSAIALEFTYNAYLNMDPEDPTTTVLGKAVNTLQDGIIVNDNFIKGTLKYVTGYTGFSGDPAEQQGNYLALKFDATEGATTTLELTGSGRGPIELDSDMNAVVRVVNKKTQKLVIATTANGETITKTYSLAGLELENA